MGPSNDESVLIFDDCGTRIRVSRKTLESLGTQKQQETPHTAVDKSDWSSQLVVNDSDGTRVRVRMPSVDTTSEVTE